MFFSQSLLANEQGLASDSLAMITPGEEDLSMVLLSSFLGDMNAETPQTVFANFMRIMNSAVLNLSLLVLLYYVMFFSVESASSGKFLGERSNPTVFVRILLGMTLLVQNSAGYSIGQVFFYEVTKAGVGFGSYVWEQGLQYVNNNPLFLSPGVEAAIDPLLYHQRFKGHLDTVWQGLVCSYGNNYLPELGGFNVPIENEASRELYFASSGEEFPSFSQLLTLSQIENYNTELNKYSRNDYVKTLDWYNPRYYPGSEGTGKICFGQANSPSCENSNTYPERNICGQLQITAVDYPIYKQLIENLTPAAVVYVENYDANHPDEAALAAAKTTIQDQIREFLLEMVNRYHIQESADELLQQYGRYGWVTAGFYYTSVFGNQSSSAPTVLSYTMVRDQLEGVWGPMVQKSTTTDSIYGQANHELVVSKIGTEAAEINNSLDNATSILNGLRDDLLAGQDIADVLSASNAGAILFVPLGLDFNKINNFVIGSLQGQYLQPGDPFSNAVTTGQDMMSYATTMLYISFGLMMIQILIGGICGAYQPLATMVQSYTSVAMIFLSITVGALYVQGALLAVVLPMIPVLFFLGGALSWLISVLEGFLAMPIVAMGMLWPSGEDEWFGKTEPMLMLLFNVLMRPGLMVIGLFAGMASCWIAFQLVALVFAAIFTQGIVLIEPNFSWLIFGFVYIGLLLAVARMSYGLIYSIPDRVLNWIGGQIYVPNIGESLVTAMQEGVQRGGDIAASSAKNMAKTGMNFQGSDAGGLMKMGGSGEK